MAQLVTRVDDELAAAVDRLVAEGAAASRSEAVRMALEEFIDRRRRAAIGEAIVDGYRRVPPTDDVDEWPDPAIALIEEEPW